MPWLIGTALIHSLAVTEKRGLFKSWTLLLSITGVLAVAARHVPGALRRDRIGARVRERSGPRPVHSRVPVAVRAAARWGCMPGARRCFAPMRASRPISRESFLLMNNVLLVAATALILLGTTYPMFMDAFGLGKISVGPPYFEAMFLVPMLPMVFLLALGMHAAWKKATFESTTKDPLARCSIVGGRAGRGDLGRLCTAGIR